MYIGIDLGTSSVKAILVNESGEVIKSSTKTYPLLNPKPLWFEQNPNDWFNKTKEAIQEIVVGYKKNVKSISFSGQMHGLVLLDEDDNVIRPAILWNDQRPLNEVDYLNNEIGKEKLLEETGNIALTGFTLPKILWVKNNEKQNFNKISKVMLPKDYLVYKLTNHFVSDVSDLSGTMLLNVKNRNYSSFMVNLSGLKLEQLPKILESSNVVSVLNEKIANDLGINKNTKIIVGGGDQAVGAIGTGIIKDGYINISLGTSGVVFVATDEYRVDNKSYLHSFAHSNGKYHLMGVTLSAAGSFEWYKKNLFNYLSFDQLIDDLKESSINDTLYFLPYLSGERSPINNPHAKGVFLGFTISHKREHFTRALIEGITYSLKHNYDTILNLGVIPKKVRLTGGGAKNELWCQLVADVFNLEVETIKAKEGPAYGAAILAMVGVGKYKDLEEATKKLSKTNKTFKPNLNNHYIYSKKFKDYLVISKSINQLFYKLY